MTAAVILFIVMPAVITTTVGLTALAVTLLACVRATWGVPGKEGA